MAYTSTYHDMRVQHVLTIYKEWKVRNGDRPDTYFVKVILPKHNIYMSYIGFQKGYKTKLNPPKKAPVAQLSLFT